MCTNLQIKFPASTVLNNCIEKGLNYLEGSCRPLTGFQNDCVGTTRNNLEESYFPEDVFTSLNGLDLLGDHLSNRCKGILRKFVAVDESGGTGTINFNKYAYLIPDDVEDTALYHYVFLKDGLLQHDKRIIDVARLIYLNREKNGIIQLYYAPCEEKRRERLEAGCLSNAMRFLYYVGAADEAEKTEDYLYDWLISEKYLNGTRYYPSPDTFLFFCSKAVVQSKKAKQRFEQPLLNALKKRLFQVKEGKEVPHSLDLSLRILALNNLGQLKKFSDFQESVKEMLDILVSMQDPANGNWPRDALFKLGGSDKYLGGSVVSTIFATAALIEVSKSIL